MKPESKSESRDPEMERLLAHAAQPKASPAFRADLKARFLAVPTANIAESTAPTADHPDSRPVANEPGARGPIRERTRLFPFVWPLILAASVAFILNFFMSRDAHLRWRVVGTDGGGDYIVDGRRMHSSETGRLLDAVQTAHEIETMESGLRLQLNDDLVLELGPKTRVSSLSFPAAHMYSIYANTGSLRITTGPTFDGNRLRVLTDDIETAVVGTTFAVDVESKGTCLCCLSGVVKCDARDGRGMQPTEAGKMCFAHHSGQKPIWGDAVSKHTAPLVTLQSFASALWKK